MLQFDPLKFEHKELVEEYLRRYPPEISEHTFTNLFAWRDNRPVSLTEWNGTLVLVLECEEGQCLLGPPVGDYDPEELLARLAHAGVETARRIPEVTAEVLRDLGMSTEKDRDNSDYVYRRDDLAQLEGRRYHRERNLVNQCLSRWHCEYEEINPDNLDEVSELQQRWCDAHEMTPGLRKESDAIGQALNRYEQLGLRGGAVRVEGRMQAFTMGERLNEDTAVVHFEKAMKRYKGLYQVVNQWFCRDELSEFKFVNREQDLGIPGLRRAKKSYNPHHMVTKFVAAIEAEKLPDLAGAAGESRSR